MLRAGGRGAGILNAIAALTRLLSQKAPVPAPTPLLRSLFLWLAGEPPAPACAAGGGGERDAKPARDTPTSSGAVFPLALRPRRGGEGGVCCPSLLQLRRVTPFWSGSQEIGATGGVAPRRRSALPRPARVAGTTAIAQPRGDNQSASPSAAPARGGTALRGARVLTEKARRQRANALSVNRLRHRRNAPLGFSEGAPRPLLAGAGWASFHFTSVRTKKTLPNQTESLL